jgi:3-oxoacyl-[acyl-carrier-protein] synthase II
VREVAVTGLGALTAVGGDVPALLAALIDGSSGIRPLSVFTYGGRAHVAAQISELPPPPAMLPAATGRRLSRPDRFGLVAAQQACEHARLDAARRRAMTLVVGATVGGMHETEGAWARWRAGEPRLRLSRLLGTPLSTTASLVSQALGLYGPRATVSTACSSSALAVAEGARAIARGRATLVLALGTDGLSRVTFSGFDALRALDAQPCRPFDEGRQGLSLGEGAAALVLEDLEHARRRGARVLALVRGFGVSADAHHGTAPHPEGAGMRAALVAALARAGLSPAAVDYINAHGSGTRQSDAVEVSVLRDVLGARLGRVPISATKSQVGHCLAAAGAIETVVTVLALAEGVVPPTPSLRVPDPAWADLDFVPHAGRRQALGVGVSLSAGFGGHNVALVLSREGVA